MNAFTGADGPVIGELAEKGVRWGAKGTMLPKQAPLAPPAAVSPTEWAHPDVGWGVVLPDRDDLSVLDKVRGTDAPQPIRELIEARGSAPILRYRADLGERKLARYFDDGRRQDPEIGLTPFGTGPGRLPLYLLICASPTEVPWRLQYSLNRRHHVGRLDLPEEGLANYVRALLSGWAGSRTNATSAVVWSVTGDSMTQKMDITIAQPLQATMTRDPELTITQLRGETATSEALISALVETAPGVVVTCSHGRTGPLEDIQAMRATLGLPVDASQTTLGLDQLRSWHPGGAVWYAQACCSAGSDDGTSFDGLLQPDSLADRVLRTVGTLGAKVAPLPTALLGAPEPLRAFIGHVEPTFDWTLLAQDTGQFLTTPLVEAIYPRLYRRSPVGFAFAEHYRGVGELYSKVAQARAGIDAMAGGAREEATYYRLTATDRESLVILGDPAVALAPLPSQR
ncbi:hypothetical protein ABZW11_11080 [Nonomuraea sp. NPDC004580]|uniref:hypothetical protein n=1 Tax=Nonomuraea sp. NPDC004580 TaxID=3154552 RepID=UPI0033BA943D